MIDRTNQPGGRSERDEGDGVFQPLKFRTPEQERAIETAAQVNHAIDALRTVRAASSGMPDLTSAILSRVEQSRPLVDAPTFRRHRIARAACVGLVIGGAGCVSYVMFARPWDVRTPGAIGSVVRGASQDAQGGFENVRRLSSAWVSGASSGIANDPTSGPLPAIDAPGVSTAAASPALPSSPVFSVLTRQVIGTGNADPARGVTLSNVLPVSSFFGRETVSSGSAAALPSTAMISDSSLQRSLGMQAQSFTARVRAAITPLPATNAGSGLIADDASDAFFTPR